MKRPMSIAFLLVVAWCGYVSGQAKKPEAIPQKPSSPAFDRIKALAGEWEGKASDGMVVRTTYRVVSNGSAVMNVLDPGGEHEMITMFHMDGPNVMVTHYCAVGNQPRMVAKPGAKADVIEFAFKDVTNVSNAAEGHMYGLTLAITDANHHDQRWTFREGKDIHRQAFSFERKK